MKILNILLNIVLVAVILIGFVIAVSMLPIKNNYKLLAVTGGSMQPTISSGSMAIVKPQDDYKAGDIITFNPPDAKSKKENTTHRIISVEDRDGLTFYKTKGDANTSPDSELISKNRVIGKYVTSVIWVGYLLIYIKTLPGLLLIIIIPATIIIYEEAKKIRNEVRSAVERRRGRGNEVKQPGNKAVTQGSGGRDTNDIKNISPKKSSKKRGKNA